MTELAAVWARHGVVAASEAAIEAAADLLRSGELVAFPTETVYGLGADAGSDAAVARIYAVKQRPRFNPLIVHVSDRTAAEPLVAMDERARRLAERFWPGPLTLVLPRREGAALSLLACAGLDTVAIRAPDNAVAQRLLRATGRPIAAPSANRSGRISPTLAEHVAAELGDQVAMVLDGGRCDVGIESTILDLCQDRPQLLRPGGVPVEQLEAVIGPLAHPPDGPQSAPPSPGLLRRHYAPTRPLRLGATDAREGEAMLGFGPDAASRPAAPALNLSRRGDVVEAAANLFAMLRALDQAPGYTGIAVAPISEQGLGVAINDRLRRAAAPAEEDWNDDRGPAAPCVLPTASEDDGAD
jgi:L-threonylcarbamoyladenylate synthase